MIRKHSIAVSTATAEDVLAILGIYNYEVENGVATLDLYPRTYEDRFEWFLQHNKNNHPLIVAKKDGETVGYACLSPFRVKPAYNSTVELSVYVSHKHQREGIGKALMEEILRLAREDENTRTVVSVITGENTVSCKMHESFGFERCGVIHGAAYKFDRSIDVVFYELKV